MREYKIETIRNGVSAELYVHDNDTIEFVEPETSVPVQYLSLRLQIIQELIRLCRDFDLTYLELNKVE